MSETFLSSRTKKKHPCTSNEPGFLTLMPYELDCQADHQSSPTAQECRHQKTIQRALNRNQKVIRLGFRSQSTHLSHFLTNVVYILEHYFNEQHDEIHLFPPSLCWRKPS